jgi:hypothetical protein
MSEAVLILQRAAGAYGGQIIMFARKLEKAPDGSEDQRAAQHNLDTLMLRVADIHAALRTLGAPYEPVSDGPDGDLPDLRGGGGGDVSSAFDPDRLETEEPDLRESAGGVAQDPPAGSGGSLGDAQNEGAT